MRILYATDVHGDRQNLKSLLEQSPADLCIVAGDLARGPFRSIPQSFRFEELQRFFHFLKCRSRADTDTRLFAESHLLSPQATPEEKKRAREYLRLYLRAHKTLMAEMAELETLFRAFPQKKIFVLPGNYDMDLKQTPLSARDLHKEVVEIAGIRIAGYGGAQVRNFMAPEGLAVPFREIRRNGRLESEPREFLCRAKPDIAVVHVPPFGFFDRLRDYGAMGSLGIREYLDSAGPAMILCGHFHENWGVLTKGRTVLVNPSNLGRLPDVMGARRGGYCFEFLFEEGSLRVGTLRQVERGRIYDLADFILETDGGVRKLVVDPGRYAALARERAPRGPGIRPIGEFRLVRDFFRKYETEETKRRIADLRKIYRSLEKRGEEVAFDLLGSANFGMMEERSDVDLVLYRRCPCSHALPEAACTLPRLLGECFKRLEERYRVEVTDCVNLNRVEASIQEENADCPALQRFVLYRSICRPVNLRLIRKTETLLAEKPNLKRKIEYEIRDYFKSMAFAPSNIYSFKKYQARLNDQGVRLPPRILRKIESYLRTSETDT